MTVAIGDTAMRIRRTLRHPELVTALLAVWLVLGVVIDAWAHQFRPASETFLTPWHGVLYTGFVATAAAIVYTSVGGRRMQLRVSPAYRTALFGVFLFPAAGAADAAWHQAYGFEVDFDAMWSPPHLLLLLSGSSW